MLRKVVDRYREAVKPIEIRIEELGVARFLNEMSNFRSRVGVGIRELFDSNVKLYLKYLELAIANEMSIRNGCNGEMLNHRFEVRCQRQLRMNGSQVRGVEALVRLVVRDGGESQELSPVDFIPLAEASGLVSEMTLIIAERIFAKFPDIKKQFGGGDDFYVAINVPVCLLLDDSFMKDFLKLFENHEVNGESIHVEITETGKINKWNRFSIEEGLRTLRSKGVKISIDDFVSGYSTLRRLLLENIDVVKIDRVWAEKIDNPIEAWKLGMLLKIARVLHPDVELVVEGLENGKLAIFKQFLVDISFDLSKVAIQSYDISGRPSLVE